MYCRFYLVKYRVYLGWTTTQITLTIILSLSSLYILISSRSTRVWCLGGYHTAFGSFQIPPTIDISRLPPPDNELIQRYLLVGYCATF
jgi:hypothetical protein